jgi:hypothetical protein
MRLDPTVPHPALRPTTPMSADIVDMRVTA